MACKVDRIVERHALTVPDQRYDSIDQYLVARWTGTDGRSSEGYKSLTEWFNKRLLKRVYEHNGRDTMGVHLEREYEVITDGEAVQRDELGADLAADGIDMETLSSEMVSWSTMRHHLKGCLEAEKEQASATTDWETNTVRMAKERTEQKTSSVLSSLASKQRLADAEGADVQVQVKLGCPECSVRVPFEEAVDRGYVCETHHRNENESTRKERWTNRLAGVVAPVGIVEALETAALESPPLIEATMLALL